MQEKIQPNELEVFSSSRSLTASLRDGMFSAVMTGLGENYLSAYGIFLGTNSLQLGLLMTFPPFVGALSQAFGLWCIERIPQRRQIIVLSALGNAAIWIPIALLSFFFAGTSSAWAWLLLFYLLYHCLLGFAAPIWNSLIGELVPAELRGRFFGYRNQRIGMVTFITLLAGGKILDLAGLINFPALGFCCIFLIAGVSRFCAAYWLSQHDDPPYHPDRASSFSFLEFLLRLPRSNFARFVLFVSSVNFAVAFAGPYFSLYMLRDLKFTYAQYTMNVAAALVTQFLMMRHWGKLIDRYGNKKILNICSWAVCFPSLLWLLSKDPFVLIIFQIYSGLAWSGFNLAASNFLFDAVTPPKRARCAAYQALCSGALVLAGATLGGLAARNLYNSFTVASLHFQLSSTLPLVFLISGLMRIGIVGFLLKKFKEVREVEPIRTHELIMQLVYLKPVLDSATNLIFDSFFVGREDKNAQAKDEDEES